MNKDRSFLTKFLITWVTIATMMVITATATGFFVYFVPHGVYILLGLALIASISLIAWNIASG